jgi:MFS family permease
MLNRILSITAGSLVAIFIIGGLGQVLPFIYPALPSHVGLNDKKALAEMVASMPPGAFAWLLMAYVLGSFCGGLVAGMIAEKKRKERAMAIGLIVLIGGIVNFAMISHPAWFVLVAILLYIPSAYLGGLVVSRIKR